MCVFHDVDFDDRKMQIDLTQVEHWCFVGFPLKVLLTKNDAISIIDSQK